MSAVQAAHLRAAVDVCSEGMVLLDVDGRALAWNKAATRLLAPALTLTPGVPLTGAFADGAGLDDLVGRCLRGEPVRGRRMEVAGEDGRRALVMLAMVPLGPPGSAVPGCTVAITDVTEQVTSQTALAEGERRVRRAEALAGTGTFVVDSNNGSAQWSEGMYRIHGVDPLGFVATMDNHLSLVVDDDRNAVAQLFDATLAGEVRPSLDHRVRSTTGRDLWLSIKVEPQADASGRILGLSGVCQDVSSRVESEGALQGALVREQEVSNELRRLDALKDEFLATASHELRTPLTSIIGFAALLGETLQEHDELVEPIQRNAREMHHLIDALLDQARLQSGERVMMPTSFPLAAAVRALLADHAEQFAGRDIVLDIADDAKIDMDREAFDLVLGNLVGNAAKYAGQGTINVSAEVRDTEVVLRVRDEGPGIEPSHLDRLFEPFFRAPSAYGDTQGTGLGLAIVRKYVQLHGGTASCDSTPGAGATFTVRLPRLDGSRQTSFL